MKGIMKIKERDTGKNVSKHPLGTQHEDTKVPACQDEQRESPHACVTKEYET